MGNSGFKKKKKIISVLTLCVCVCGGVGGEKAEDKVIRRLV